MPADGDAGYLALRCVMKDSESELRHVIECTLWSIGGLGVLKKRLWMY